MAKQEKEVKPAEEKGLPSNVVSVKSLMAAAAPAADAGAQERAMKAAALAYGIDNTVAFVKFGGALAGAIKAAKADGKFDVGDLALIFPVVPLVGPMIAGVGQVPKELGDLSSAELDLLVAEVAKIEGIGDKADVILKIKASLKFAHAGYEMYNAFAKKG